MSQRRPKCLYVYTYNFMHTEAGSYLRAQEILKRLHESGVDLTVYTRSLSEKNSKFRHVLRWRPEDIRRFKERYPNAKLYIDEDSWAARMARRLRHVGLLLLPGSFPKLLRLRLPWLDPNWAAACRTGPDVVFVNYSHSLAELNGVPPATLVVDQHDVEFVKNRREWKQPSHSLRVLAKLRRELAALSAADIVLAISYSELLLNKLLLDGPQIVFYPYLRTQVTNGANGSTPQPSPPDKQYDLCFLGSDTLFNREGLARFLEAYARAGSTFSVAVAGSVCTAAELRRYQESLPNVHWLGYVPDSAEVFRRSRASISPVAGGGTKIKIIESLQHGIPVFASEESLEGLLPGYEQCVLPLSIEEIEAFLARPPDLTGDLADACRSYMGHYENALESNAFIQLFEHWRSTPNAEMATQS